MHKRKITKAEERKDIASKGKDQGMEVGVFLYSFFRKNKKSYSLCKYSINIFIKLKYKIIFVWSNFMIEKKNNFW